MRILHILNDGPTKLSDEIIAAQSKENEVRIIDLSRKDATYEDIVDAIFSYEKVVSW